MNTLNKPFNLPVADILAVLRHNGRSTGIEPCQWDLWTFFCDELPIEISFSNRKAYVKYKRNSNVPYSPIKYDRTDEMTTGKGDPSEKTLKLHSIAIVTKPLISAGPNRSCVLSFKGSNPKIKELAVNITRASKYNKKEDYIKPFLLWGEDISSDSDGNLIMKLWPLKCDCSIDKNNCLINKTVDKIRQFLLLDTSPTWFNYKGSKYTYNDLCRAGKEVGYDYGELVVITNKDNGYVIPGVIIGDPAVTGREKLENINWEPQLLFLQLVDYKDFHNDVKKGVRFIPLPQNITLHGNGDRLSIYVTKFRFAPKYMVGKWPNEPSTLPDDLIVALKRKLGVYFEKH